MRVDLPVRRRRPLSLTPLIDVIFLLLLFFMLSSTFLRFAKVEIVAGTASAATTAARTPDILIRLDGDGWRVNGAAVDAETALAELTRLEEAGASSAVLLVRGEVTSQALVTAIERVRRETTLSLTVAR